MKKLFILLTLFSPLSLASNTWDRPDLGDEVPFFLERGRDHEDKKEFRRAYDHYFRAWLYGKNSKEAEQGLKRMEIIGKKFFQIGKYFHSQGDFEATILFFETAKYLGFEEGIETLQEVRETEEGKKAQETYDEKTEEQKRKFTQDKLKEYPEYTKDLQYQKLNDLIIDATKNLVQKYNNHKKTTNQGGISFLLNLCKQAVKR